ncbi:MAG TPA: hypothetical protein VNJ52_06650 [Patescibacteria group bacterium]|nr:hypothetical protein [Patescibacteria group bacterium]
MGRANGKDRKNTRRRVGVVSLLLLAGLAFSSPLAAQEPQGPLSLPPNPPADRLPPPAPAPPPQPAPPPRPAPRTQDVVHSSSPISHEPLSVPVDQIIREFAAHEAEFRLERDNFTYEQTFVVQTIDDEGQPDGEYRMTSDITFTPSGERYEKITYAPVPTLTRVSLSEQDLDGLRNIQPFVLTTEEVPKYNITYVGRQRVDELHTYVFDVAPKKIEKHQRYFQGRIWVDVRDLEIVKTDGKAVPDIVKGKYQNLFPRFETYRENIEGHYWFPTYTHADDVLHFRSGDVHIRMAVWWTNYKRFRVTVKLISPPQPHR